MKPAFIAAAIAFALVATGCDSSSGSNEEQDSPDHIWIRSVGWSGSLVDGDTTAFTVILEHELVSTDSGEIDIGFNNWVNPEQDMLLKDPVRIVAKGRGFDTVRVSAKVKSWGTQSAFRMSAVFSEHPHAYAWESLAEAEYTLIPKQ